MELIQYLKDIHYEIERINHLSKSDSAYSKLTDLVRGVKARMVHDLRITWEDFDLKFGRHLKLSEDILHSYRLKGSDKSKNQVIEEFKKEYLYDLENKIRALELREQDPGSPIHDE